MEKNDAMNFENIQIFLESHRSNEQSQKTVDELNNLLKRLQTENAQKDQSNQSITRGSLQGIYEFFQAFYLLRHWLLILFIIFIPFKLQFNAHESYMTKVLQLRKVNTPKVLFVDPILNAVYEKAKNESIHTDISIENYVTVVSKNVLENFTREAFTAAIFDDTSIACIRQALIFHNDEPESVPPTDFGQLFGMLLMLLYFTVGSLYIVEMADFWHNLDISDQSLEITENQTKIHKRHGNLTRGVILLTMCISQAMISCLLRRAEVVANDFIHPNARLD